MSGLKLAAAYSHVTCRLGFCGQRNQNNFQILDGFLKNRIKSQAAARKAIESFEAAYPYYCLIAKTNSITDPLTKKVVEAFWVGNSLLDQISPENIKNLILQEFTKSDLISQKEAKKISDNIPYGVNAHHSFHVLFIGSITGRLIFTPKLRDVCRISWGKVKRIKNKKLEVLSQPLKFKNKQFYLAKPIVKDIVWYREFLPQVKIGDNVSFHWGQACQILSKKGVENLEKYTLFNIRAFKNNAKNYAV